jgi:hypothetical protein
MDKNGVLQFADGRILLSLASGGGRSLPLFAIPRAGALPRSVAMLANGHRSLAVVRLAYEPINDLKNCETLVSGTLRCFQTFQMISFSWRSHGP